MHKRSFQKKLWTGKQKNYWAMSHLLMDSSVPTTVYLVICDSQSVLYNTRNTISQISDCSTVSFTISSQNTGTSSSRVFVTAKTFGARADV